ncbi:hypothetical protein [Dictyobacter kobayashii]|uniref:Uncharacterized protein n=1 Tax=Dictyobacter kobayashii TaxID=2014872 RepID=A0A402AYQ3_9CHLR|nr:hypothetical protein [Dictyobacter kobayashii]GCE24205.1 hypothetical protein KDK_80050 [Dictyobacter kobayashii]
MMQPLPASVVPGALLITNYWPRQQTDGENIGFGVSRNYIFYRAGFRPLQSLFFFLVEPRLRTRFSPPVRIIMLALIILIPSLITTRSMVKRGGMQNSRGYYVLDDEGKAISFLGTAQPEAINGHLGMGRKKFLQQINK